MFRELVRAAFDGRSAEAILAAAMVIGGSISWGAEALIDTAAESVCFG